MPRKFKAGHLQLFTVLFFLALVGLSGCSLIQPKEKPKILSSTEIYSLLASNDDAPKVEVFNARVLSQGIYRSEKSRTIGIRTDGCPKTRYLVLQRGREVTAQLGLWIGFEFILDGSRSVLEDADLLSPPLVPLTLVVRHPPYRNPMTGQITREEINQFSACLGHPGFAVWRMTSDWELVSGPWSCELQSEGTTVATAKFLVRGEVSPLPESLAMSEAAKPEIVRDPAPADLTVVVAPQAGEGVLANASRRQEEQDVDFSEDKLLAKWVPVRGAQASRASHTVAEAGRMPSARQQTMRPERQLAQSAPPVLPEARNYAQSGSLAGKPGVVVVVSSNQYEDNARNDALALRAKGYPAFTGLYKDPRTGCLWHTVRLEGYVTVAQAREGRTAFMSREGRQAFVAVRGSVPNPMVRPVVPKTSVGVEKTPRPPQPKTTYAPAQTAHLPLFSVQVGACLLPESARTMQRELQAKGYAIRIVLLKDAGGKPWYRVLVGQPYGNKARAREAVRAYKAREGAKAYVIDKAGRVVR